VSHTHLNYLKRCQILALWKAGFSQTQIAEELGVHKSTICREFKRNITFVRTKLGYWTYKPDYAQGYANDRRAAKRHYYKFTEEVAQFVREKLLQDWSPEQISGYAKRWELFSISHERIYQFLIEDKKKGGDLYTHLRSKNKKYRKRYGSNKRFGSIKDRIFIDDRPEVVDEKNRIGDWEIDTIIGKGHKQAIVTIVERFSKYMVMKKIVNKNASLTEKAVIELLGHQKEKVHTITSDNGSEFANHKEISKSLDINFYFAHPYSSWERGLNENTNGLVRQYLKKGCEFTHVTDESLAIIAAKLNNRPRKTLGYKSPNEVFIG
jgi:IS30 family transposase